MPSGLEKAMKNKLLPPAIVASNIKKLNVSTNFNTIGELDAVLEENSKIGKNKEDKFVHYSKNFLEIVLAIHKKYFFDDAHPYEIEIGLGMLDLCFKKYNIQSQVNLCEHDSFLETIKYLNNLLCSSEKNLFLATAAAVILSRVARWNSTISHYTLVRFNYASSIAACFESLLRLSENFTEVALYKIAVVLIKSLTYVSCYVNAKYMPFGKKLSFIVFKCADEKPLFSPKLSSEPKSSMNQSNSDVIAHERESLFQFALNLMVQTLGRQIHVKFYIDYMKSTKNKIFDKHLDNKDNRKSEHSHCISALGVALIAKDCNAGGNMLVCSTRCPILHKMLAAAKETADDLLSDSMDLRKKQKANYRKRRDNKIKYEHRKSEVQQVQRALNDIGLSKGDMADSNVLSDGRQNIQYKHSKWSILRNSVLSHGAVSFLLQESSANKAILVYSTIALWAWANCIPTFLNDKKLLEEFKKKNYKK